MFLLTTDILDTMDSGQDAMALSKMIQKECCFNKRMSDILADIALLLHSNENETEWKNKDLGYLDREF